MSEADHIHEVLEQLAVLAPVEAEKPMSPPEALKRFKSRAKSPGTPGVLNARRTRTMTKRRYAAVGLTFVIVLGVLMAFPSVRAAAGDFLGLFRVQKFAPISVSPRQLALLEQLSEQDMMPGEFVSTQEPGEPERVESLSEASERAGYRIRTLPFRQELDEIYVTGAGSGYVIVNLAGARAIVEAAGADPLLLPDSLEGARIDVHVYQAVQQLFRDGYTLMQTQSPEISYPPGVDPTLLGEAVLQVLGMDADSARRTAGTIDWTSTLLLPIPQEMGTYREVTISGGPGVLIEPINPDEDPAVMWQRDGILYMLTGPVFSEDLIQQANAVN